MNTATGSDVESPPKHKQDTEASFMAEFEVMVILFGDWLANRGLIGIAAI